MSVKEGNVPNSESSNKSNFTSVFITVMMILFVIGGFLRNSVSDPVIFNIGRSKYTVTHCKKYVAYVDSHEKLSQDMKFQKYYYQVIKIARKKAIISNLANRMGLKVPFDSVRKNILKDFIFFENGEFSREKFLDHIKKLGVSESDFYVLRKEELLHKQFWYFIKNSYYLDPKIVELFNQSYNSRRLVRFAKIDHSLIKINYTNSDLKKFYLKNKENFKSQKQYKYEYFLLSLSNLSKEERVLLQCMVDKKNFDGIKKNFKSGVLEISQQESEFLNNQLFYYLKNSDFEVQDCFVFHSDRGIIIIRITSVDESKYLSFEESKEYVINAYEKKHKPSKINVNTLNWQKGICNGKNFYYLDLPYKIAESIFSLSIGKIAAYHLNGISYFVVVDSIIPSKKKDCSESVLRNFLNEELVYAIEEDLTKALEVQF